MKRGAEGSLCLGSGTEGRVEGLFSDSLARRRSDGRGLVVQLVARLGPAAAGGAGPLLHHPANARHAGAADTKIGGGGGGKL